MRRARGGIAEAASPAPRGTGGALLVAGLAAFAAGCLDFHRLLDDCRDGGNGCILSTADGGGGGGSGDGGTSDGGPVARLPGALCHQNMDLCFEFPTRTSVDLNDVWGAAPDDVWVVGEGGVLMHWNGTALESRWGMLPGDHYAKFWGRAADDVYLVGPMNHPQQHFDGAQWAFDGALITHYGVEAVDGTAPDNLTAVGTYGTVLHRGAGGWQKVANSFTGVLTGVVQTATDCLAAGTTQDGDGGTLFSGVMRCDGGQTWTLDAGATWGRFSIGGVPAVATSQGNVFELDGGGWAPLATPSSDVADVHRCVSTANVSDPLYCVGANGTVWPDLLGTGLAESPFLDLGQQYLWGAWTGGDGTAWASGAYGQLAQRHADGGWTAFSGTAYGANTIYSMATDGTHLLAAGSDGVLFSRGSGGWVPRAASPFPGEEVRVMQALADGTWVAAGTSGHVWKSADGGAWKPENAGDPSEHIQGLWASSASDVYAATGSGRILHRDDAGWTVAVADAGQTAGVSNELWKVTGDGTGRVWAVGASGTVVAFDGTAWSSQQLDPGGSVLYGVWAAGPDEVWAVGGSTVLWHHTTAGGWESVAKPAVCDTCEYFDVWGFSPNDVYAVGWDDSNPRMIHYDGNAWSQVFTALDSLGIGKAEVVRGLDGTLFIGADRGTILRAHP
jgi:hypothetical protein